MKLFTATVAQTATVASITAVEVATVALNASEAFKSSGAGYNDKMMLKMVSDIICNEASVCAIEGTSVTRVGIKRNVVPFGVRVTLSNGQDRSIRVTNTKFGVRVTERNPQGWTRTICTVGEVREMLIAFSGAQSTAVAATADLKEVAPVSGRVTRAQVQAAVDAARHS